MKDRTKVLRDRTRTLKGKYRVIREKGQKKRKVNLVRLHSGWTIKTTVDSEIMKKMPSTSETFIEKGAFESVRERLKVFLISGR